MENLIKTAINDLRVKKKRPSMEEIFNMVKRKDEVITMEEFKDVFDRLYNNNVIGKFADRNSYFITDKPESNDNENTTVNDNSVKDEEIDLMNLIKRNIYDEKLRNQEYINELRNNIEYLKGEIVSKNHIIYSLITKISNPLPQNSQVETIPHVSNAEEKISTGYNYPSEETGNKKESKNEDIMCKVEIIGDSILNGLVDKGLAKNGNIKTRKYPGCTTDDLKHHVIPTIEKKPSIIIIHAGTNDITNEVETIPNMKSIIDKIKKKSPHTKISISSLTIRKDRKNIENKVIKLNEDIKRLCAENLIDFISHENIDESCLGFKNKLHLNKKGNAYLANNFINFIKTLS